MKNCIMYSIVESFEDTKEKRIKDFLKFCKENNIGTIQDDYVIFGTLESMEAAYELLTESGYELKSYYGDKSAHVQDVEYFSRISLK